MISKIDETTLSTPDIFIPTNNATTPHIPEINTHGLILIPSYSSEFSK